MTITCGFELEVSGGADNVLAHLNDMGLTEHDRFHAYHCDCCDCTPTTDGPLFKAQQDCTADGELITRILEYGSADMETAIAGISRALLLGGANTSGDVGNHVHVDKRGMDIPAQNRLNRLFGRYENELFEIAAAGQDAMRTYNGSRAQFTDDLWNGTTEDGGESWDYYRYQSAHKLSWKSPTVEFRLWNSTKSDWRIRTHVGLSVAMVEAATAGVTVTQHDARCLEDVIGDFIDAPTWAGILRQRFSKGGLSNV